MIPDCAFCYLFSSANFPLFISLLFSEFSQDRATEGRRQYIRLPFKTLFEEFSFFGTLADWPTKEDLHIPGRSCYSPLFCFRLL